MSAEQMPKPDDYDELHWEIIELLYEGRGRDEPWGFASPEWLAEQTGESAQLIGNRLRDLRMAGAIDKLGRGFYRANPEEDPRNDG